MTVVRFEEIIKEGAEDHANQEPPKNGELSIYQKGNQESTDSSSKAQRAIKAEELCWQAYINKSRVAALLKKAGETYEESRRQLQEIVGYDDYEGELFELVQRSRIGSIDRKKLEVLYPDLDIERVSNAKSFSWVIKLKVKE